MYYSSGNYEAFARPKKPEGVDNKSAYIVGSGLAALTAACYLVRDGQMKGERVHVLEKGKLPGGACDGYKFENLLKNPKQLELLKLIDVLVDGPFMKDLRDEDLFFRGSSNQRLINVKKSLETGKVIELHLTKENPIPEL